MTHIHIHTKYSLLDAIIEPEKLIEKLKEFGDKAVCVTEHGNLYSSIEIYKLCQEYGIKYLHGCEVYICDDVNVKDKSNKYHHLVLISKNETGRRNLIKLVSLSNQYKYYGKPRIDFKMLSEYADGLICLSACMAGEIQRFLYAGDYEKAKAIANQYKDLFKEDYYLEFQCHSSEHQQQLNRQVIDLANDIGIKYVVTTDAHYLNKEDQKYHNIFVQIGQAREAGETYNDCYIQTENEIRDKCKTVSQSEINLAIQNCDEIADKCNVTIPLSDPIMPHNEVPTGFKDEISYLIYLCKEGWKNRKINTNHKNEISVYKERLKYEINTIREMGFEGYYLLVWSYANSVKRRGIARGSGGGSLVAYLINIVDIDPIQYGLYFERFIDVGALDLLRTGKITKAQLKIPDFDLDFGKREDRDNVLKFVIDKYGQDRVASLGSFQYIWAKGAIKDIGKVLNIPFEERNAMTSKIDKETIQKVLDLGLLDEYKSIYPDLFEYAQVLAGLPKSFSAHPCGKVIAMNDISYYNAIDINDNGEVILQGDMHTAEDLGLIKADFLGLRTVDVIYDTLEMIGKDYEYIAPHNIDLNDESVFKAFRDGKTAGIFQFESTGMRSTLKNIECNSIHDLTVANALYRPGSMSYIDNYANRRKGIEKYTFLNDDLKPILKDSYAIIVFQEQLIEIGRLAKLSNPDELRKATAKKKSELLDKIKPELFEGLQNRGWTDTQIEELWESMVDFAKYSFNKSHAAAYALIAYITMFLKVHHTKEFLCAWANSVSDKAEKVAECIQEAIVMGVPVYCGKYNRCNGLCQVYKDGIMIGTKSIKHCNSQIADELLKLSSNNYNSFIDIITDIKAKTSINSRQLEILTGLDFFSDLGCNKYLLEVISVYNKFYGKKQFKKSDLEKLGLTEKIMLKYSKTETDKMFKDVDVIGLINELVKSIENKPMSITESVKFEKEYLEYTTYVNPKVNASFYIVTEYKVYSDKSKPYVTLRQIKTGEEIKTKVAKSKNFVENPFRQFSVLKVDEFQEKFKTKNINGEWVKTEEKEKVLELWTVIKE